MTSLTRKIALRQNEKKRKRSSASSSTNADVACPDACEGLAPVETCEYMPMDEPLLCPRMREFVEDKPLALSLDETVFLRAVTKDRPADARSAVISWLKSKLILGCADTGSNACISLFDKFEFTRDSLGEDLWLSRPHFSKAVDEGCRILTTSYVPRCTGVPPESCPRLDYAVAKQSFLQLLEAPSTDEDVEALKTWLDARDGMVSGSATMPTLETYERLFKDVPLGVRRAMARQDQGTELWLRCRRFLVTGSQVAAVVDHNPYQRWEGTLVKLMRGEKEEHDEQTLRNFKYGHDNEPHARAFLKRWFSGETSRFADVEMMELGMVLGHWDAAVYGLAYSPDGVVAYTDVATGAREWALIEYKCPALAKRPYPRMPAYYFDQVQVGMGLFGLPRCFFVVWSPLNGTSVESIDFEPSYFENVLLERVALRVRLTLSSDKDRAEKRERERAAWRARIASWEKEDANLERVRADALSSKVTGPD